nr:4'-phosphopantetheinyl transferase superfamily protein [Streptomyces sp. NRRL F-525]
MVRDAARSLHPAERAELARTVPESRSVAFARCWTRKEAFLKATGEGLSGAACRVCMWGPAAVRASHRVGG